MTRFCTVLALGLLAGCGVPLTGGQLVDSSGQPIEVAYVYLSPACLVFCNTQLATTGSDSDVIGAGSASNTQTSTQTQTPTNTGTLNTQ